MSAGFISQRLYLENGCLDDLYGRGRNGDTAVRLVNRTEDAGKETVSDRSSPLIVNDIAAGEFYSVVVGQEGHRRFNAFVLNPVLFDCLGPRRLYALGDRRRGLAQPVV